MNNKGLVIPILLTVTFIFFAVTREYWQAIAKYIFFCLITGIAIRPIGLFIGDFLRRRVRKD